jgi:hypothetical protein
VQESAESEIASTLPRPSVRSGPPDLRGRTRASADIAAQAGAPTTRRAGDLTDPQAHTSSGSRLAAQRTAGWPAAWRAGLDVNRAISARLRLPAVRSGCGCTCALVRFTAPRRFAATILSWPRRADTSNVLGLQVGVAAPIRPCGAASCSSGCSTSPQPARNRRGFSFAA